MKRWLGWHGAVLLPEAVMATGREPLTRPFCLGPITIAGRYRGRKFSGQHQILQSALSPRRPHGLKSVLASGQGSGELGEVSGLWRRPCSCTIMAP